MSIKEMPGGDKTKLIAAAHHKDTTAALDGLEHRVMLAIPGQALEQTAFTRPCYYLSPGDRNPLRPLPFEPNRGRG